MYRDNFYITTVWKLNESPPYLYCTFVKKGSTKHEIVLTHSAIALMQVFHFINPLRDYAVIE